MKIKIVKIGGDPDDQCYDCGRDGYIINSITDWEECTPQEYNEIVRWMNQTNKALSRRTGERWLIFQLPEPAQNVADTLEEFRGMMKADKEKEAKRKATTAKRKKTLVRQKEEKERAKLAELQKKYGGKG